MAGSLLFVFLQLFSYFACYSTENPVRMLSLEDYTLLKKEPGVKVVYFGQDVSVSAEESHRIKHFLREFKKSASVIQVYDVEFSILHCKEHPVEEYCDRKDAYQHVYIFKDGTEMLQLGLENMFDVNSILSNILQIVLLREVPILQEASEIEAYMEQFKGQTNLIFSFQKAIGTYQHRVLMEVAYAFHPTYGFAITTEQDVVKHLPDFKPSDLSAVWVLWCAAVQDKAAKCDAAKYQGKMDLAALASYVKFLDAPPLLSPGPDTTHNHYEQQGLHTVYVYYDDESRDMVQEESERLSEKYRGILGFILINMDNSENAAKIKDVVKSLPSLGFKFLGKSELVFMDAEDPETFILQQLKKLKQKHPEQMTGMEDAGEHKHQEFPAEGDMDAAEEEEEDQGESPMQVEKEDDVIAMAEWQRRAQPIDRQYLPALTDKTFPLETQSRDFLVVLFYITFDAKCMTFLRAYSNAALALAKQSQQPLATVDCFDWTDVCAKYNVSSYPTVRIYRKGREPVRYTGMLGASTIVAMVKLYLAGSPKMLHAREEVQKFLEGQIPEDIARVTSVAVIGLFGADNKEELKLFKSVAAMLEGKLMFGWTVEEVSKSLGKQFGLQEPGVVVYKRNDAFQPHVALTLHRGTTPDKLYKQIVSASLPVFPELTPYNYPAYHSKQLPLVLLFSEGADTEAYRSLGLIAKSDSAPNAVLAWLDTSKEEGIARNVLKEYISDEARHEDLVVVDHKEGTIHVYGDMARDSVKALRDWIHSVLEGKINPSKFLAKGEWKPLIKGYDFNKLIAKEARKSLSRGRFGEDLHGSDDEVGSFASGDDDEQPFPHEEEDGMLTRMSALEESENEIRMQLINSRGSRASSRDTQDEHRSHDQSHDQSHVQSHDQSHDQSPDTLLEHTEL